MSDLPPVFPVPEVPQLDARMRQLGRQRAWDDDEDILDAADRESARLLTNGAPGSMSVEKARQAVAAGPRHYVNPYEALLDELRRTVAFVVMLEMTVREHDDNGGAHRTAAGRSVLARYERERDRQINVAEKAIRLGIAERTVRLAEREAEEFVRVVVSASSRAGLTSDQRRSLMGEIAAELRARKTATIVEARAVAAGE